MGFMDPGNVVWFEIGTADAEAVEGFYGGLLGWSFAVDPDSSVGGVTYTRIMAPGMPFPMGAIYRYGATAEETVNVSIVSADVPDDQARLEKAGASVVVPATGVGDVTVFARLADPRGNVFSVFANNMTPERLKDFAAKGQEQMAELMSRPAPNAFGGFEIGTADAKTTTDFYERAFGWRFAAIDSGCSAVFTGNPWPSGGLFDLGPGGPDYLVPLFQVTDVAATTAKAVELGATVAVEPHDGPDGRTRAQVMDPHGNRFGLVAMPAL